MWSLTSLRLKGKLIPTHPSLNRSQKSLFCLSLSKNSFKVWWDQLVEGTSRACGRAGHLAFHPGLSGALAEPGILAIKELKLHTWECPR